MLRALVVLSVVASVLALSRWEAPAVTQDIIDQINNTPDVSWTAGWNSKFERASLGDVRELCGVLPDPKANRVPVVDKVEAVPATFDAREQWPQCPSIAHIRDQSHCGSCWAFGAVEAFEDRVCISSNGKFTTLLSPEDMVDCCDECGMGCYGGYLSGAWSYLVSSGIVTGGDYGDTKTCSPYTLPPCDHHVNGTLPPCGDITPTPACVQKCKNGANWLTDKHKAKNSYTVRGVTQIQTEIMNNGPVEVSFTVYQDFLTYKSGVYRHITGQSVGGHAVKMMGWGTEGGQDYWLIANSWNTEWGDQGLFKIRRGNNECGIEGDVHGGLVA